MLDSEVKSTGIGKNVIYIYILKLDIFRHKVEVFNFTMLWFINNNIEMRYTNFRRQKFIRK